MKSQKIEYSDIRDVINQIADEINTDLGEKKKEKYFQDVILLYSFVENLLKWLVFTKILWDKSERGLDQDEIKAIGKYCQRLTFHSSSHMALSLNLIDFKLYKTIDDIRNQRNTVVHQFWIYSHRNNRLVLRKKLEKLAAVANQLVGVFNDLTNEMGVDFVYELQL